MTSLNLGILAHVDAGKTSLTERLLFMTGVIDKLGSVDAGNTLTDSLALERQRGITIKSAVASFVIDDVTVNLIDTPGHPDFIAEVERVLNVLDGAVLVISAVEGVQPQTRVLMRALQRLHIPTLLFINKIDRGGANYERVFQSIAEKLQPAIMLMGSAHEQGSRSAGYSPYGVGDAAFMARLVELLAGQDEALLAAYVSDEASVSYCQLRDELVVQTKQARVHPVFLGSAMTGAGVDALIAGIKELLPPAKGDADAEVSGTVFKIERGASREKIAYVRLFAGTVGVRDRLHWGRDHEGRVTAISVFERGAAVRRGSAGAGQIAKLWGLTEIQIGDEIGTVRTTGERRFFAPPTLETVIVPTNPADRGRLHVALVQLAEQDPLINLRQDDIRQELFLSLYGEVQKEVIQETLLTDFHIDVQFRETTMICIERVIGSGSDVEMLGKAANPFLATVGLRIDPAPLNSGIDFRLDAKVDSMPLFVYKSVEEFRKTMEETVQDTLRQGLYGWQVTDCRVTLTQSGYVSPSSSARDFRLLTPLVLMEALQQAGASVCEPMHHYHLEIPTNALGATVAVLARLQAMPQTQEMRGSSYLLEGDIQAARVHELQQRVPGLTSGEGVLEAAFDHYEPIHGTVPMRPRTDRNPLNRKEYLLHVLRRV
ncbi:MAG: TetM/TetW/TetO/TetS family tetracycline resistance ribosomal protection protein [Herpetosiphonaceae bacterium]|nr:TetM/TetW/TetO/TetS family tetracycline resistance ribosomal protection protein [Herpetosiphonaceae bacterium]